METRNDPIPADLLSEEMIIFKEEIMCRICLNVCSRSNQLCMECNNPFCSSCIEKILEKTTQCPICKKSFKPQKGILFNNLLTKMKFACLFKDEGCKIIVDFDNFHSHIQQCEFLLGKEENGNDFKSRLETHCKKYHTLYKQCEQCKKYILFTDFHESVCKEMLILCPVCKKKIKRKFFTIHKKGACLEKLMTVYQENNNNPPKKKRKMKIRETSADDWMPNSIGVVVSESEESDDEVEEDEEESEFDFESDSISHLWESELGSS